MHTKAVTKIGRAQKITVHVPQDILQMALSATHKNITETVKAGLQELARKKAYDDFRSLKGKVKFSIDFNKLREDD